MTSSRESVLLRGSSAAAAEPWQRAHRPTPPRTGSPVVPTAQPVETPVAASSRPPVPPPAPRAPDLVASPEVAAKEIAAFEPHLLLHNDNDELGSEVVAKEIAA